MAELKLELVQDSTDDGKTQGLWPKKLCSLGDVARDRYMNKAETLFAAQTTAALHSQLSAAPRRRRTNTVRLLPKPA